VTDKQSRGIIIPVNKPEITLYNTLSRSLETFEPMEKGKARVYSCGPTVYHYAHLGNLRATVFADTLRRVLEFNGYDIAQVMNITDVGHLVSDEDAGEDKMEKGAKRQGKTVWEVAKFYEQAFKGDMAALGNLTPHVMPRATEHLAEQVALIENLVSKGKTYQTEQAIYFNVDSFADYTKLSRQPLDQKQTAVRSDVNEDPAKRHPADFALWFFTVGRFADHAMHWPSPWGEGFPGWHIECSAMSMKYLGEEFDLHTGGIEHIGTHHTNEIAQSEAATGHTFVHYWLHNQHLTVEGGKMAKSSGDFLRLQTVLDQGFHPLAYRYFCLTGHYRAELAFSWENLQAAATSYRNLLREIGGWDEAESAGMPEMEERFLLAVNQDLDTPTALSIMWEVVRSSAPAAQKRAVVNKFDQVLGLGLSNYRFPPLNKAEQQLIQEREAARGVKDWVKADQIRQELLKAGIEVEDTPQGTTWVKLG
jgi:cysteinyl-tRNA synthetase